MRLEAFEGRVKLFRSRLNFMRAAFDQVLWSHGSLRNYNLLEANLRRVMRHEKWASKYPEVHDAIDNIFSVLEVDDLNRTGSRLDDFLTFFDSMLDDFARRVVKILNDTDRVVVVTAAHRDRGRKNIAHIDVQAALVVLVAGLAAFAAGIFGMNIGQPVYDVGYTGAAKFWTVIAAGFIAGVIVAAVVSRDLLTDED